MKMKTPYDGLWRTRLDALDAAWPDALAGRVEALHKARVASRRIREALPVVGAAAPPEKVEKLGRKVRSLTRALGPIRELDVELAMLEEEAPNAPRFGQALPLLRRDLAARRHELRERLAGKSPAGDLDKLLKHLARVAEPAGKAEDTAWRAALAARLLRRAKRLQRALEHAGALYASDRLHDVRIAAKKLRYALEIAQESGQHSAAAIVNALKKEQERLGHLHDLQSLLKHVRELESSLRAAPSRDALAAYADRLERECREGHAQFVGRRRVLSQCARDARQVVVPTLTAGRFRQARVAHARARARVRAEKRA